MAQWLKYPTSYHKHDFTDVDWNPNVHILNVKVSRNLEGYDFIC